MADEQAVVRTLQQIIQKTLKPGHDYGIIPGVEKPSLLKPKKNFRRKENARRTKRFILNR